jgi:hypothetical protein
MKTDKRKISGLFLIILIVLISICILHPNAIGQENDTIISNIKKHLAYLASDELKGRGTGTPGARMAAEYIADQMKTLDLIPSGSLFSYFQSIPMTGSRPLPGSELKIETVNGEKELILSKDFLLFKSGAQTFIPAPVPMVFVGYGIIAPEFDYNDYQSVDVAGKVVVCLSGEPESKDPGYFEANNETIYSYPESKQRIAIAQGAIGSVIIPVNQINEDEFWDEKLREFSFEDVTLAYRVTGHLSILLNSKKTELLFSGTGISFNDISSMIKNHEIRSFNLNTKLSFRGKFEEREFIGRNVAGLIKGEDPNLSDTYIIVSAHYDHLGIGKAVKGDSIYNGLVDNAIGVGAVLELMRIFKEKVQKPKRSILFLLVTGEEKGLLGSKFYVDHPLVPLYKTIANINIDGLAIFDNFNDVVGVGAEYSTLGEILEAICRLDNIHLSPIPPFFQSSESFARSDQIAFAQGGIPSLLISDGLNYKHLSYKEGLKKWIYWAENIYHTPFDDISQPINYDAVEQHISFLFNFCHRLSRMEQQPQWKNDVNFRNARLRSIAERR